MNTLVVNLYNNIWNCSERIKKDIPTQQGYQEEIYLKKCFILSQINKSTMQEMTVLEKLAKYVTS